MKLGSSDISAFFKGSSTVNKLYLGSDLVWQPVGGYDTDAAAYIAAVEAADGQALETGVKDAINAFVVGLKDDGLWVEIEEAIILQGARTIAGATVALKGGSPEVYNFVSGDYNRIGLKGNASNKWLKSARNSNADPQDDFHFVIHTTEVSTGANSHYLDGTNSANIIVWSDGRNNFRAKSSSSYTSGYVPGAGFVGVSRSSSTEYKVLQPNIAEVTVTNTSVTPGWTDKWHIYKRVGSDFYTNDRKGYYSFGGSLNLGLYKARLDTLATAIAAAI